MFICYPFSVSSDCSLYEYVSANIVGTTPIADLSSYQSLVADLGAAKWQV